MEETRSRLSILVSSTCFRNESAASEVEYQETINGAVVVSLGKLAFVLLVFCQSIVQTDSRLDAVLQQLSQNRRGHLQSHHLRSFTDNLDLSSSFWPGLYKPNPVPQLTSTGSCLGSRQLLSFQISTSYRPSIASKDQANGATQRHSRLAREDNCSYFRDLHHCQQ